MSDIKKPTIKECLEFLDIEINCLINDNNVESDTAKEAFDILTEIKDLLQRMDDCKFKVRDKPQPDELVEKIYQALCDFIMRDEDNRIEVDDLEVKAILHTILQGVK